jgi:hypothetical protein
MYVDVELQYSYDHLKSFWDLAGCIYNVVLFIQWWIEL